MHRFLFLFLTATLSLFAHSKEQRHLAVTEGEPSALVAGCVNVITGDLYIAEEDVVVQGYIPLRLPRHYIRDEDEAELAGWAFIDHLEAKYKGGEGNHEIKIQDPNGSTYYFRCPSADVEKHFENKKHPPKFRPPPPEETPGLTNTSQGEIGGRNNLKNACIRLENKGKYLTVHCSDQTMRRYKIYDKHKNFKLVFEDHEEKRLKYLLESETLPSGHQVRYHFDDEGRVDRIWTSNPSGSKTYASANFHYLHRHKRNGPDVDIFLSDGRTLSYRFDNRHRGKVFRLSNIILPESPPQNLFYYPQEQDGSYLISRIGEPNNHFVNIDYYQVGRNSINGISVDIKNRKDSRFARVKGLSAPVGQDATGHMTHQFFYDLDNKLTDVRLADHTLTRYRYDSSLRLMAIDYFGAQDAFQKRETFEWSGSGELLARSVFDAEMKFLSSKRLHYDDRGNVIQEDFYGNLSGIGQQEVYTIRREYSRDNRDLLLKEEEQNGKVTRYAYVPNTNLLAARLICEGTQIRVRTFYEYNADHVLITEIHDDGTTPHSKDMDQVTTRRIKRITPLAHGPYIDMPGTIEELYWDGQHEELLKKTQFTYTTGGRIQTQEVFDALGTSRYTLSYEYDSFGRVIRETDALGQSFVYTYDEVGNRNTSSTPAERRIDNITYDYADRPTELQEVGCDGTQRTTRYAYDLRSRKIAETNYLGNTTHYVYDTADNLIETRLSPVFNEKGECASPTIISTYDCLNRERTRKDPQGNTIQTDYNARSQPTRIRYPDGSEERFIYNLDGTLKEKIDREGFVTSHFYDIFGHCIRTNDANGASTLSFYHSLHLHSVTDALGVTTHYTYDGAGRKIAEDRQGERTSFTYDALNRLHSVTKGDLTEITEYDLLGRTIEERQEDAQGILISKITHTYDEVGNRTSSTRFQMGKESKDLFTYDAFDRLIIHQDPLGFRTQIAYDSFTNDKGQKTLQKTTTDPLGRKTVVRHDALNRIVQMQIFDPNGVLCLSEENQYDLNSNLIIHKNSQALIQREYDRNNRLVTLIEPQNKTTRYTYTPRGHLKQTSKPDGVLITRDYDGNGNLLSLISSDGSIQYAFTYNPLNQLTGSLDLNSQTTTLRTLDHAGRVLTEKLANGITMQHGYDCVGRRVQLTLPDQSRILYAYNAAHLKQVSRCDPLGNCLYTHLYQDYDLSHNLLSQQLIGGLGTVDFTINPLGQRDSIHSSFYSQQVLSRDPLGHISAIETPQGTSTYQYDPLCQLIKETGHTYRYDAHFNRVEKDGEATQFNALNQLKCAEYDLNGNLLRNGNISYTYDALDRLIRVETPEQSFIFTYDSFHRRLSKTIYARNQLLDQSLYIYDGFNEIGSLTSSGNIRELRVLGMTPTAETGATIAIELKTNIFAPISDLRGNIVTLISLDGTTRERYQYNSFGEHTASTQLNNPWRFASKRLDETGLIYYGRRYYDPTTARWTTPDPLGLSEGINLYAFVRNNPLTHFDLYGLFINPPSIEVPMISPPRIYSPMLAPPPVSNKQVAVTPLPSAASQAQIQRRSFASMSKSASLGVATGGATYGVRFMQDFQVACFYIAVDGQDFSVDDLIAMRQSLSDTHAAQLDSINSWVTSTFDIDPSDPYFTYARDGTKLGLEGSSIFMGGRGLFTLGRNALKTATQGSRLINVGKSAIPNKIWTSTESRTSVQNAYRHWKRHGKEFSTLQNSKQYVEAATSFTQAPPPGTLMRIRPNWDIVFYNPNANTLAITNYQGLPRTMYKPNLLKHRYPTNLDYFHAQ